MFTKSPAPSLRMLAKQCSQLVNEKKFHQAAAFYYNRLFNENTPPADFTRCVVLDYTPYQKFLQEMAQNHQTQVLYIDAALTKLESVV